MEEKIKKFAEQFGYEPELVNGPVESSSGFIVAGMGGSHLSAGLLKIAYPALDIIIHKDYGVPTLPESEYGRRLFIASSYSGSTEETVDALQAALTRGMRCAVISTGGPLIELALKHTLPYIQLPSVGIQPRFALGYSLIALVKMLGNTDTLTDLAKLKDTLQPFALCAEGDMLATWLADKVPVIYSSRSNGYLSYVWKIKINESVKIPAFANVLPEANHNEMNGFDIIENTKSLGKTFGVVFLRDTADDSRIARRMDSTRDLYRERGITVYDLELKGATVWEKMFNSIVLADWVALGLATHYGTEPEQVPMIEEFKELIKKRA